MTSSTLSLPIQAMQAGFRRFTVPEYHRLIQLGILTEDDNLELLEGYVIHKMARNPPHDGTLHRVLKALLRHLPAGWDVRIQSAVTLIDSEPEPDLAVVTVDANDYLTRHPMLADIGLLIEVSDSTLDGDRLDKGRIYARAGIPTYWIVNIPDTQVEVYTQPSGAVATPGYASRQNFRPGDQVPFTLSSGVIASLDVRLLLG